MAVGGTHRATPDRTGRVVLTAMVVLAAIVFLWLVATLAVSAFA
jgi:hypothetical protein